MINRNNFKNIYKVILENGYKVIQRIKKYSKSLILLNNLIIIIFKFIL